MHELPSSIFQLLKFIYSYKQTAWAKLLINFILTLVEHNQKFDSYEKENPFS